MLEQHDCADCDLCIIRKLKREDSIFRKHSFTFAVGLVFLINIITAGLITIWGLYVSHQHELEIIEKNARETYRYGIRSDAVLSRPDTD